MDMLNILLNQGVKFIIGKASNIVPEALLKASDNEDFESAVKEIAGVVNAMDDKTIAEKRVIIKQKLEDVVEQYDLDDVAITTLEGLLHKTLGLHIDL